MRLAAKKDNNHNQIAAAFRSLGWTWVDTHQLGGGFPDGAAGKHGVTVLVEIKDGSLKPSARKLTDPEKDFHESWRGAVRIINSVDDVIALNAEVVRSAL